MKITIPVLFFLCFCSFSVLAQSPYSIKGTVLDTTSNTKLENTNILILNAKDSILVKSVRAKPDGSFSINNLSKGKFILLLTYPDYADYSERFSLDSINQIHDFGKLNMVTKAKILAEVIIRGRAAIVIKGDTTEFNAEKYVIEPNSKVEDLLKQFPGIEVDKDGKITAQGKPVEKVLLDGEEFFGDDPTLVTKNIRGDMVDKVQMYDKKSDQATFTGIDDGVRIKTLNIVTKEGKKSGYFGKVVGSGATDDLYAVQGMVNVFEAKKKFAAYGNIATDGRTGLGFEDASKFGTSSSGGAIMIDGGGYIGGGSYDELEAGGRYNNRGLPMARTSGAHYDSKWNKDKETINLNYKIGSLSTEGAENSISQFASPNLSVSNNNRNYTNYTFRQKLDAAYQVQLDSSSTLKITVDGTLRNARNSSNSINSTTRDNILFTEQNRISSTEGDSKLLNSSLFLTKKFKKVSRTMSLNITQNYNEDETKGFLNTINELHASGTTEIVDQYKPNASKSFGLNSNLTYTEPLSKTLFATLNYGLNISNSSSDVRSFNKSGTGQYDLLDAEYSNYYKYDQLSNMGGANFTYKKDKSNLTFGTRLTNVNYKRTDVNKGSEYTRNYLNWSPQVRYSYRKSQQESFGGSYSGSSRQPSIYQIQTVKTNSDPLNISIGNPDLKPSYTNNFSFDYYSYKVLSSKNLSINGSYSFTTNSIVGSKITDAEGKSTYQSVNFNSRMPSNFSVYVYGSKQLKSGMRVGANLNVGGGTSYDLVNSDVNTRRSMNYSLGLNLSQAKLKKYNFSLSITPSYNTTSQSIQTRLIDNPIKISSRSSFTINLPGKVDISSDATYTYTEKTSDFSQSVNPLLWNSTISKKFFKAENLVLSIRGNNLLNNNAGFQRSPNTQSSYTTISRYFMGSLSWDFSKMGISKSKN